LQAKTYHTKNILVKKILIVSAAVVLSISLPAQEFDTSPSLGLFAGAMNYQGDLKPNSFTFQHSNLMLSLIYRKPFNRWFAFRGGITIGKVEAADRFNRDYLQRRNLSFATNLKEVFTLLEADLLDISTKKFTPYAYGGVVLYNFNPYTFDANNRKVYLKPLSTEGQGLPGYPDRKPYKLTQFAAAFGGGLRIALSNCTSIALEFSQRKTFTDYLDDVSTSYINENTLLSTRGPQAVDLAYRGDEVNSSWEYPPDGEQRGTPTEMDWYYFIGMSVDVKIGCLKEKLSGLLNIGTINNKRFYKRCPTMY
jgi:hypothetical protein